MLGRPSTRQKTEEMRLPLLTALCLALPCGSVLAQSFDTRPTTPSTPSARAYGPTSGGVSWQRSSDDRRVVGYEISRDGVVLGVRDTLSYVADDLAPGRGYNFAIVAIDSAGQRSGRALARIETPDARPNRPTGLAANVYSKTAAGIRWDRSGVFGERYVVKRDGEVVVSATNATSYVDTSLSPTRPLYLYEVIAVNRQGQRSTAARLFVDTRERTDGGTPMAGPAAPSGLRSVAYSRTSGAIAWDRAATPGLRYEVSRDGESKTTTDGTSYVDDTLMGGTSYTYEVVTIDRQGRRSAASSVTLVTSGGADEGPTVPDPDPMEQDLVRVDFEITVPAHVSDELSVNLSWGTQRIMAEWVGDEQWRATADFPRDRYVLAVNFRDRNGDIMLGRAEAVYRTPVDEGADTYTVVADDFDTERWDDDADGVSNIDELRRGTDPLIADTPLPPESTEVLDGITFTQALREGATYFEPRFLELELPVEDRTEVVDETDTRKVTTITEVDFSADGNGTFRERYNFQIALDRDSDSEKIGTRSREGNSVTWSGVTWAGGGGCGAGVSGTMKGPRPGPEAPSWQRDAASSAQRSASSSAISSLPCGGSGLTRAIRIR